LLARNGVGPDTAAALLITADDNPKRLRSEASFAALCGASPVEASSGKTQRRRLNRGSDRRANCALHTIVLARLRWDPTTRAYVARRVAEGKTRREALRCLKRYAAREIYQLIKPAPNLKHPSLGRLTSIGASSTHLPRRCTTCRSRRDCGFNGVSGLTR
jgi:transposase